VLDAEHFGETCLDMHISFSLSAVGGLF
jgi:hypothetical protein